MRRRTHVILDDRDELTLARRDVAKSADNEAVRLFALHDELETCIVDQLKRARDRAESAANRGKEPKPLQRIAIPYWLATYVHDFLRDLIRGLPPRARNRKRADAMHWHRYISVLRALDEHRGTWPKVNGVWDEPGSVFRIVSNDLKRTAYAGQARTIAESYDIVNQALRRSDATRFYADLWTRARRQDGKHFR